MDSETVSRSLMEPVFAVNADREIAFANERFLTVTQLSRDELVGAEYALVERYVEEGVRELRAAIEAAIRGAIDEERVELTMVHPEAAPVPRRIPAELRVTPLEEDDAVTGVLVVLRDVSARKDHERSLRRSRRRFEAVLETPESFIGVLDPDGTLITANSTALELVDTTHEAVAGEPFPETPWWTHSAELQEQLRTWIDRAADGEYVRFDAVHETPDGETVPVDGVVRPVRDVDDEVVSVIVEGRDVSERRAYERELERQNERLERFAAVVSHDLRNPLNVASARLTLALDECDSEHLDDVARAHDRMASLIDDLLTLTREGGAAIDLESVDLASVVDDCWETVETGSASLRAETDRTVTADPARFRQLVENLLDNAATHGGPDVTITVGTCDDGFYVADDGAGIDADERDQVFEPGYSTADGGTGFGLNIVETIGGAHDWDVTLTESRDGGARFEFRDVSGT